MAVDIHATGEAAPPADTLALGAEQFTQARIERILRIVVAIGCGVVGTQAFLNALNAPPSEPARQWLFVVAVFVPLAVMELALLADRWARPAAAVFAVVFALALIAWVPLMTGPAMPIGEHPWIWYLLNVATVAAVIAFPLPAQIVWAVLIPALYVGARLLREPPAVAPIVVVLDAVFSMILAGVLIGLAWLLREVGIGVDAARRDAILSSTAAASAEATEQERAAVAALMHDSVLAALIAAERAETEREAALAVSMAREALTRLANTDQDEREGPDEPVTAEDIARGLDTSARAIGLAPRISATVDAGIEPFPGRVARALVLAASQALANAVEHAEGRGLQIGLVADAEGVRIRVADTGDGFDPGAVPADRLGIRGSIVARVAAVGGRTSIRSDESGTIVQLRWERPR